MKRRQFCTTLPMLFGLPALISACEDDKNIMPNGKSVIVIGAGIAGLVTARTLRGKGFSTTILEAQNKIGGRLQTNRSLGIPFDEGASWIHGPRRNPITDLAEQAGAKTFLTNDDNQQAFDKDGKLYTDAFIEDSEKQYNSVLKAVIRAGTKDQSFEMIFNKLYPDRLNTDIWKYLLSAYLEFDTGADIAHLSSIDFDDDEVFAGEDVIVTNGYDTIAEFLAKGLTIQLNSPVSAINYEGEKVKVTANNQIVEADFVVTTVPLGVLKQRNIQFIPTLPANKQNAIERLQMGTVNKFLLTWETAFWDTNLQYIAYTPEEKGKFNYFLNMKKFTPANALITFSFGNYAIQTEQMLDDQIIGEIMLHLRAIYGNNIPSPKGFLRTKWASYPYTFGAYSFATNGTRTTDFNVLAENIDRKLFFAGEHTSKDYRGTVHGAYLSGLSAAQQIIDL